MHPCRPATHSTCLSPYRCGVSLHAGRVAQATDTCRCDRADCCRLRFATSRGRRQAHKQTNKPRNPSTSSLIIIHHHAQTLICHQSRRRRSVGLLLARGFVCHSRLVRRTSTLFLYGMCRKAMHAHLWLASLCESVCCMHCIGRLATALRGSLTRSRQPPDNSAEGER